MTAESGRVLFVSQGLLGELMTDEQAAVLTALNTYNPMLKVERILSFPGGSSFAIAERADSKRFALVAEPRSPLHAGQAFGPDEGTAESEDGEAVLYKAVLYVLVSPSSLAGRNIFATQTIFPALCALITEMLDAPGLAFSAHPVYFLDLSAGELPTSVRRSLMLFAAMGMGYLSAHRDGLDAAAVPRRLDELLASTGDQQRGGRRYYSIDAERRALKFSSDQFVPGALLHETSTPVRWAYNGSSDKFYWSEVVPIAVVAAHSGYKVDSSDVVTYLETVKSESEGRRMSEKYQRTVALFKYIQKLGELER